MSIEFPFMILNDANVKFEVKDFKNFVNSDIVIKCNSLTYALWDTYMLLKHGSHLDFSFEGVKIEINDDLLDGYIRLKKAE